MRGGALAPGIRGLDLITHAVQRGAHRFRVGDRPLVVRFLQLQQAQFLPIHSEESLGLVAFVANRRELAPESDLVGPGRLKAIERLEARLPLALGLPFLFRGGESPLLLSGDGGVTGSITRGLRDALLLGAGFGTDTMLLRLARGEVTGVMTLEQGKHHEGGERGDEVEFVHGNLVITRQRAVS
jgi:hypothetical protein